FMASCVCCVAWEPSPPGRRRQHHFKLECPLRCQVSCQKKGTAAEYQQNPLTFSPTTAVFIRVTAQKASL
ncbi:hypothetical protein KUCAC02_003286, partial [Chaenocephalus aceratus]